MPFKCCKSFKSLATYSAIYSHSRSFFTFRPALLLCPSISTSFDQNSKMSLSTIDSKFSLPARFMEAADSVWVEFVDIAQKLQPLNLGQGFPDYPVPDFISGSLAEVTASDNNAVHQYTRGFGHPRLVVALSKLYSKLIHRQINPFQEILITCGAYEALFCAIAGFIQPADEVIIIEPFYDCYRPIVQIFGGTPKFIPLRLKKDDPTCTSVSSADWKLDTDELTALFNKKTKLIIVNTPHNPTGKVFSREELEVIANLCKKYNVVCLADEVYEWLVYKPKEHIRIGTLPGMWERTLTIGSAGKTFSMTGWKCGWIYGPDNLLKNVRIVHQNNIYTYCTPIQEALAVTFEKELAKWDQPNCYFQNVANSELLAKRDAFMKILIDTGFKPTIPEGGYFVIADWSKCGSKVDLANEPDEQLDYKFTKWMAKNYKILGIPPSAFYCNDHKQLGYNFIRYCFFKKDETLNKASDILNKWQQSRL